MRGGDAQMEGILRPLELSDETLVRVKDTIVREMLLGLSTADRVRADIQMFVTYVRAIPDGSESGKFLALDLGGTNFRVLLIDVNGSRVVMEANTIYMVPETVMTGTGEELFDHIASCIESFLESVGLPKTVTLPLGFTFSFPCKQDGLARARLAQWTKGFTASDVEGEDVVLLLHEALDRKDISVRCVAVINDTVGALMSCAHEDQNCQIGLILGTGTNACYMEQLSEVETWDLDHNEPHQVIINTEWGAFGSNGSLDFVVTEFDTEVDVHSINRGRQIYEKMISGMYMGEIARQVLVKLVHEGLIFRGRGSPELFRRGKFLSKYVSEVEEDIVTEDQDIFQYDEFSRARLVLEEMGIMSYSRDDILLLQRVCQLVSTRAAHLAAAGVAGLLGRIQRDNVTVAVDGSLFRFHPTFKNLMTDKIATLLEGKSQFKLMLSEDGSGKGAALVAAVASRLNKQT